MLVLRERQHQHAQREQQARGSGQESIEQRVERLSAAGADEETIQA
ncbi:hypothetical protein [Nocardia sp. NPDC003726]